MVLFHFGILHFTSIAKAKKKNVCLLSHAEKN